MPFTKISTLMKEDTSKIADVVRSLNGFYSTNKTRCGFITKQLAMDLEKNAREFPESCDILGFKVNVFGYAIRGEGNLIEYKMFRFNRLAKLQGVMDCIYLNDDEEIEVRFYGKTPIKHGKIGQYPVQEVDWAALKAAQDEAEAAIAAQKKRKDVTFQKTEVLKMIEDSMRALPITHQSPHQYGGYRSLNPAYIETITEMAWGYAATENSATALHLPTHSRTKWDNALGKIDGETKDSNDFTQEDRLQMKGGDVMEVPYTLNENSKRFYNRGDLTDVKMIFTACTPHSRWGQYDTIPVEAWIERKTGETTSKFEFRSPVCWTWDEEHKADIVFVYDSVGYLVSKAKLRGIVIAEEGVRQRPRCKPNKEWGKNGTRMWNVYITKQELSEIADLILPLPEVYDELLTQNSAELFAIYEAAMTEREIAKGYGCKAYNILSSHNPNI